jgi:hypothetical protein
MNLRTTVLPHARSSRRKRPPLPGRRPALYLGTAAVGAVLIGSLTGAGAGPAAGSPDLESASVAAQLGLSSDASPAPAADAVAPLEQLVASRSERDAAESAAAQAQQAADQAELDRRAAEEAAAKAAADEAARVEAARAAEAEAAAARPGQGTSAPVAPSGSYQDYAMGKLGGSGSEFTCLENLWGKESGWNPNAQNPSSTAYGIAQFLDSTWAGTGIAKTSDGYRQIDAGLIYIEKRFGSPCGAWSHSQSTGWY